MDKLVSEQENLSKDSERDYYMSPQEAIDYGLIDQIAKPIEKEEEKTPSK